MEEIKKILKKGGQEREEEEVGWGWQLQKTWGKKEGERVKNGEKENHGVRWRNMSGS